MKEGHKGFNGRENYNRKVIKEGKKKETMVYSAACAEKRKDLFFSFVSLFSNFHGIVRLYGISSEASSCRPSSITLNNKKKLRDFYASWWKRKSCSI
jgi:hypothetical protein